MAPADGRSERHLAARDSPTGSVGVAWPEEVVLLTRSTRHPGARAASDQPRTIVVIGASSGIGLAAAGAFSARGDHVVLGSRSATALHAAAENCEARGAASVSWQPLDVLDRGSVTAFFDKVKAEHGQVHAVVHTAMTMAYGTIADLSPEVFHSVVRTGLEGTFAVAQQALAIFRAQQSGTLVVLNSIVGSIAAPQLGAYVTAKWGQAGLIRVLQLENRDLPGVHICSVAPAGVNTPIYQQAANVTGRSPKPPIPIDQPDKVADRIVRCVDRPRPRVSVGVANPLMQFGFSVTPRLYDALVGPLLNRLSLTNQPTEPADGSVFTPNPQGESERGPWNGRWSTRRS